MNSTTVSASMTRFESSWLTSSENGETNYVIYSEIVGNMDSLTVIFGSQFIQRIDERDNHTVDSEFVSYKVATGARWIFG